MQDEKKGRTQYYTFTSKKQLFEFYLQIIPKKELTDLIDKIEAEPFVDLKGRSSELDRIKKLEWNINRYLKKGVLKLMPDYR